MTRTQAQNLLDSYCFDLPLDEEAALSALMEHDLAALIYGDSENLQTQAQIAETNA